MLGARSGEPAAARDEKLEIAHDELMTSERRAWDRLALIGSLLCTLTGVGYVWLIQQQGNQPTAWFLSGLIVGVLLAVYGAATAVAWRTAALMISGTVLVVLGLLGILSIGVPILGAGVLVLAAGVRSRSRVPA
jgi:hypothetical protein